jgi:hypothetical protein
MDYNPNFVRFILLVKLKCNRDQIHDLNLGLANKVNSKEIHYTIILFFLQNSFLWREGDIPK